MPDRRATVALAVATLAVLAIAGWLVLPTQSGASRKVFFGLDVPTADLGAVAQFGTAVGHRPTMVSVFVKYDTANALGKYDALRAEGYTPFVTLEPWNVTSRAAADPQFSLSSIVDGTHDAALRTQAKTIASFGASVYLRLAHEMNGNWYPWAAGVNGNTPALYVAAWRHVHDLFARTPGVRVQWVWAPAADNVGTPAVPPGPFYPGDDYVDFAGVTGYEHNDPQPRHTFEKTISEIRQVTGKPVILAEIGADGPNKGTWLAALGPYILSEKSIAGLVYYDTSPASTGATGNYALTSPADVRAFSLALSALGPNLNTRATTP